MTASARMSDIPASAPVVVCGAGVAGISTAFHLTRLGIHDVVVLDSRPPLTLTSDKSTECYRNWWPTPHMVALMSRSIDLLEAYADESNNRFSLSRRGYLYVTADTSELERMASDADHISGLGAGPVRTHQTTSATYEPAALDGYASSLTGADLFRSGEALRDAFGFVGESAVGGIHVRRAGWLSAHQLGTWMLEEAVAAGALFVTGEITGVRTDKTGISSVVVDGETTITCTSFINAAGPLARSVGRLVGVEVPVHSEIHQKVSFKDHKVGFDRSAPMVIWSDPQHIAWSGDERDFLMETGNESLLGELPRFVHGRPEGGGDSPWALGLWELTPNVTDTPQWPIEADPLYPELVVRGLTAMLPAMSVYRDGLPEHTVDGGYYTKTIDNIPLIGPIGPEGSFICAALSGYGIMAACAAGELAALHVVGRPLPAHSDAFRIERLEDREYLQEIRNAGTSGQI